MSIITLAPFPSAIKKAATKFCHGECQKDLDLADFPKKPARFCKKCTSKINNDRYHERKAEKEMYI